MLCRATHNVAVQPLPHLVHLGNQVGIALAELACVGGFVALVVHLAMCVHVVDGIAIEA